MFFNTAWAALEDCRSPPHFGTSRCDANFCAGIFYRMNTLVNRGLVERQDGELRLTAVTMKAVRADMVLHSPAKVPAVRAGVALLNMTIL